MKELIKKLYKNDVVRYVFFGGCTTMVNLVSFYILRKAGTELNTANLISIILAILFAYVVNSKYVFQDKCETLKDHIKPLGKFIGARLATMVIEVGGVWLLVEQLQDGSYDQNDTGRFLASGGACCSRSTVFSEKRDLFCEKLFSHRLCFFICSYGGSYPVDDLAWAASSYPDRMLWKPGDHNGMVGDVVSAEKGCNRCIYGKAEKRENPFFYSYDSGIGFDSAADVCGSALCTYGCR